MIDNPQNITNPDEFLAQCMVQLGQIAMYHSRLNALAHIINEKPTTKRKQSGRRMIARLDREIENLAEVAFAWHNSIVSQLTPNDIAPV